MQAASVRRVSFFWSWIGGISFTPSHRVVHLMNRGDRFLRRDSARGPGCQTPGPLAGIGQQNRPNPEL